MRAKRHSMGTKLIIAIALVVVLAALVVSGCGRRKAQVQPVKPSVTATQAPSESTGTGTEPAPAARIDAGKAATLDKELNSIDAQLNDVQMPDDSEFNSAGSALE